MNSDEANQFIIQYYSIGSTFYISQRDLSIHIMYQFDILTVYQANIGSSLLPSALCLTVNTRQQYLSFLAVTNANLGNSMILEPSRGRMTNHDGG